MKIIAFCLGCWLAYGFISARGEINKDSIVLAFGRLKHIVSKLAIPQPLAEKYSDESALETPLIEIQKTDPEGERAVIETLEIPSVNEHHAQFETLPTDPVAAELSPPRFSPSEPALEPVQWQEPANIEDVVGSQQQVVTTQYHPLWASFTTRSSAQGFASRVQESSGISLDVHTLGIGNYQVMLPYSTSNQLRQNLAQIKDRIAITVE